MQGKTTIVPVRDRVLTAIAFSGVLPWELTHAA